MKEKLHRMGQRNSIGRAAKAIRSDKYHLYQESVQAADSEVAFFDRVYRKAYGRRPMVLREDFCGTFLIACEWIRSRREREARGIDLDSEPLEWGRANNLIMLSPDQQNRLTLIQGDVRDIHKCKADVVAATNFSYFIFRERNELRHYFECARKNLKNEGVLVLDLMGGPQCHEEEYFERRRQDGFTYVWNHDTFNPINHHTTCRIHFSFPDGSEMKNAFVYEWRLWTIPELSELLLEAGFTSADAYWECTEKATGEGNGIFTRRERAPSEASWVAYVVGVK